MAPKPSLDSTKGQDDLSEADLHLKVKHFMKRHGVTLDHLLHLFRTFLSATCVMLGAWGASEAVSDEPESEKWRPRDPVLC